jgi:hypothetical protein
VDELRWQLSWLDESDIQKLLMPVFNFAGNVSWEAAVKKHLCRCFDVNQNTSDRELCLLLVAESLQYAGNLTWVELADFWNNSTSRFGAVASPSRAESCGLDERDLFKICSEVFNCYECTASKSWTRQLQFVLANKYGASPDWRALFVAIQSMAVQSMAMAVQGGDSVTEQKTAPKWDFFSVLAMRLRGTLKA